LLRNGLRTIGQLIHTSPSVNGNGEVWKELINRAEAEKTVLCKYLDGKALFTSILRLCAAIHRDMRDSLLPEQKESPEEFREQRRRKRNPSEEQAKKSKPTPGPRDPRIRTQGEVPTRNFFAPLRASGMDVAEETTDQPNEEQPQPSSGKSGRPLPTVLTSATNVIQLQRHIKSIVTCSFEFRNTRSGTRIVTKERRTFQLSKSTWRITTYLIFPFTPNQRSPPKPSFVTFQKTLQLRIFLTVW
jgi:hypothetical protein